MTRPLPVFLLDMDGVLVEPLGYRRSVHATLAYFTETMGLGDLYPGEEAIACFESISMTSEWDIIPILLAAILDGLVERNPDLALPADLMETCQLIHDRSLAPPPIDTDRLVECLRPHFKPGAIYSDLALALNQPGNPQAPFPHLLGQPILECLLAHSRDVYASLVTSIFQHFSTGSQVFERAFGQPRRFETDSYLLRYDRPLLQPHTRDAMLPPWQAGQLGLSLYTARPSAPPDGYTQGMLAYSPEAELVLQMLRMEDVPLVGNGQVCWLAGQYGQPAGQFVKPSPVHALAAIAAAVTRQVKPAVLAAGRLFLDGEDGYYRDFPPLSVHVFEDSGGNIQAVRQAAKLLARDGLDVQVNAWGIAASPAKRSMLIEAGAALTPDINTALQAALEMEGQA